MATYADPTVNASSSGAKPTVQGSCQEFSIKVPKSNKKRYHVMRFHSSLGVDFCKWKSQNIQVKMERENNSKEFKGLEEEMPKYGAGSEFGREAREEAKRKKYGYVAKKYRPEDQPWILKQGGKTGKKFKGIREGGVSDNTAYYVFTQAGNGIIEAYPLQEWYKFQPIQRYKALSAEEAEQEYGRRNKIINYFSLMLKKRLRNDEDGELEDPDEMKSKKGSPKKKEKDLKISEMDDWDDMDDDNSESDIEKGSDDEERKKSKKKVNKKGGPKKKKRGSDDEAVEESDDGDEEGRELDYISDSSESASDHEMKANKELKGVAEEDALRKLLNSESEEEEEENEEKKKDQNASNTEDEDSSKNKKEKNDKENGEKAKEEVNKKKKLAKNKKKSNKKNNRKEDEDSSSDASVKSTDSDSDSGVKNKTLSNKTKDPASNNGARSRSSTPTSVPVGAEKRKLTPSELAVAAAKKAKLEVSSSPGSSNTSYLINSSDVGVTEDAVRRYLMRKPMTTTELLHKFKIKKTGLSSEQLVNIMTQILKNINPVKQTIKNKMYLSIKPT